MTESTRRRFLQHGTLAASFVSVTGLTVDAALGQATLPPTPACGEREGPTVRQTEGPFFKPRSPERADLREPGLKGQPIELLGFVLTRTCRPVARAGRPVARRQRRRIRQQRLPPARPPVHRCARTLSLPHHRAGLL